MKTLKPGLRLKSAVCATEIMVIRAPSLDAVLACGGTEMLGIARQPRPAVRFHSANHAAGHSDRKALRRRGSTASRCCAREEATVRSPSTASRCRSSRRRRCRRRTESMNIAILLDMAADTWPTRTAVRCSGQSLTYEELRRLAAATARRLRECGARSLAFLDLNGPAAAVALYGAARAEVPHVPLNYRLSRGEIESLLRRLDEPLIVAASSQLEGLRLPADAQLTHSEALLREAPGDAAPVPTTEYDPDAVARSTLHQRHDRCTESRGAPPRTSQRLCACDGRVWRRRRGRGRVDLGAAVSRCRGRGAPELDLCGASDGDPARVRCRGVARARRGRARDSGVPGSHHARADRRAIAALGRAASLDSARDRIRGWQHAWNGDRARDATLPRGRLHECVRAYRDQLDDMPAGSRGSSLRLGERGPRGTSAAGLGRPAAARGRGPDPGRRGERAAVQVGMGSSSFAAHRCPANTANPAASSTPTAGSRPAIVAGSTRRDTCSSMDAPTMSSCGAARTSRPARSKRCSASIRRWPMPRSSPSRARSGARPSVRRWCPASAAAT